MIDHFASVELAPRDPILGITEAYNADSRKEKVNLGVGVYYDDSGKIPLLAAVKQAEKVKLASLLPRGYLPIDGIVNYNNAVQQLLFGADSAIISEGRAITAQAIGGTGALKIGADYLRQLNRNAQVYISDPSWENHRALFEAAGFTVNNYAYYDPATRGVDFAAMCTSLQKMAPGSIVVLHACCHNPTGADLNTQQWQEVAKICQDKGLIAFLDMAYQGFADGIREDSAAIDIFATLGLQFFISSSFSKNFSLYGERVGALSIVTKSREQSTKVLSQLKRVIRTNYSNPPTHGGSLVAAVLASSDLRMLWEDELANMRKRICEMRQELVASIYASGCNKDFSFITKQRGMFSYTGLTAEQVERLKEEFAIYAVSSGRICLAALNHGNVKIVANAIASVL